jgi:hypothetical protein
MSRPGRVIHHRRPGFLREAEGRWGSDPSEQDGDWAKRLKESVFDYKLHVKRDLELGLIRDLDTTPASVHDSRVDLSASSHVAGMQR